MEDMKEKSDEPTNQPSETSQPGAMGYAGFTKLRSSAKDGAEGVFISAARRKVDQ